jgi:hypothetical protein
MMLVIILIIFAILAGWFTLQGSIDYTASIEQFHADEHWVAAAMLVMLIGFIMFIIIAG